MKVDYIYSSLNERTCSYKQQKADQDPWEHTEEQLLNQNGPLQMKYVAQTTLHSTFTECTGKQAQFETQWIDMLLLCPVIAVIFPPCQIKKKNKTKMQPICQLEALVII